MADENLNIRLTAKDEASPKIKNVENSLDDLGASAKATRAKVTGAAKSMGGMGRNAGMAGIQVQQFVGQVQMGTNPMVAFSQQATDLGFVLGAPLLGAIAGIASSIALVLLPAIFSADEAFADLHKRIKSITEEQKTLAAELKVDLIEKQTEAIHKAAAAYGDQQDEVLSLENSLNILQTRLKNSSGEQIVLNKEVSRFKKNIKEEKVQLELLNLELEKERRMLAELKQELDLRVKVEETLVDKITTRTFALNTSNVAMQKEADIIRQQVKPAMQLYLDAKTKLQLLNEEGLITDDEMKKRLVQLMEIYKASTKEVKKLKEATYFAKITMIDVRKDGVKALESSLMDLVSGTKSVSEGFRNMAKSVISSLMQMAIRNTIIQPLAASLGIKTFDGGGYTGSGARSGGVDGKGGFPAILHPNETVVDHTKGQSSGGGAVNITLNISTGVAQTVRAELSNLMPAITEATKAGVLEARQRGGSYSRALAGI